MQIIKKKVYWYQAVAMYIAIFLQFPMLIIFGGNETISTSTGQIFSTNDIYQSITLIAITTILFVSIVGLINVSNSEELKT
mgnify:CR=1 FL=1